MCETASAVSFFAFGVIGTLMGALALGEGKGGVATSLPEGEKLLVAYGIEGGEMAEWVEAARLFFESEEHHLVDTLVDTLA